MKLFIGTLLAVLFAAGCTETEKVESPVANIVPSLEPTCPHYGGFEEKVCAVSIYSLITNPETYYGRTVAFAGFVHKSRDGTVAVYPNPYSAENGEIASAILCKSLKISCDAYVGKHAELFGKFTEKSEPDFFFEPVGTVELVHVRSVTDVVSR